MASTRIAQGVARVTVDVFLADGMEIVAGGLTVTPGTTSLTGGVVIGADHSFELIGVPATTATIAVPDDTVSVGTIAQPAGTIL